MKFEELIKLYDVKLCLLKDKTRLTKKGEYGYYDTYGNIMVPRDTRRKYREITTDVGILCQYIQDLGKYLCCLDIDQKDFPLTKILGKFPSSIVETKHGYHIYYLSHSPIQYKQLSGKEKEMCPVDLRGQRDPSHMKEGNYCRYYPGAVGNLLLCNFNDIIKYCYSLFGITPKPIGEYDGNMEQAELIKQNNKPRNNIELFLAYYLYYQKTTWESAYDSAFPWGIQLAGWLDKASMQRIAYTLMRISDYYSPKKWIQNFLTAYQHGDKGYPHFGKTDLPLELQGFLNTRFNELNEDEIKELAKLLHNIKLYQILELII